LTTELYLASLESPFIPERFPGVPDRWIAPIARILGGALGVSALHRLIANASTRHSPSDWSGAILDALNIRVQLRGALLQREMAVAGPLAVVANHPFGILDALLALALLPPLRADLRYLGQHLWQRMPHVAPALLPLQPTTGHRSQNFNARSMRAAIRWVRDGHALAMFPAPRVATWSRVQRAVVDPPWSNLLGNLVVRAGADVLPVHIAGRNSVLFQAAATLVHPLHHALLIRELLSKNDQTVCITVGTRLSASSLGRGADAQGITRRIRAIIESL
jgi:putative hemolysin